ncbi:DUF397 domain-containing protein [Streptomyces sp. NPDC001493]
MTTEPLHWFTSSYSTDGGQCVEVATNLVATHGAAPIRDSKDVGGPVLGLSTTSFTSFVAGLKSGDFTAL